MPAVQDKPPTQASAGLLFVKEAGGGLPHPCESHSHGCIGAKVPGMVWRDPEARLKAFMRTIRQGPPSLRDSDPGPRYLVWRVVAGYRDRPRISREAGGAQRHATLAT